VLYRGGMRGRDNAKLNSRQSERDTIGGHQRAMGCRGKHCDTAGA